MRKFLNTFIVVLIALAVVLTAKNDLSASTTTAPASIKLGGASASLKAYVGQTYFPIKYTSNGTMAYCLNHKLDLAQNITVYKVGELDAGIVYILNNGYPKKSITGDKNKDYYITQTAIWWYLDDTKGTSNLGQSFKSTGQDSAGLRSKIVALKEAAKKNNTYKKPTLSTVISNNNLKLDESKEYYVSEPIGVTGKNVTSNYTVKLSGAPTGSIVTNIKGNQQSSFKQGDKFIVKVPVSSVNSAKTTIKVSISASGQIQKAYEYAPKNSKVQHVVITELYYDKVDVKTELELSAIKNTEVRIIKVDSKTKEPVAGATLVIKDSSGNVVKKWKTDIDAVKFTDLQPGTYTVEEVSSPSGYKKSEEKKEFTIAEDGKVVNIEFENEKLDKTKINILKIDSETKQPVSGATLQVKDTNGKVVAEWITNYSVQTLYNLEKGEYTLEEVKAPNGYRLSTEKKTFTVAEDEKTVDIEFENEKLDKTKINILKIDSETKQPVSGATLVVKDANGNVIEEWVSTTEVKTFNNLNIGTYTLEETKAPNGYRLSTEKKTFTVAEDEKTVDIEFENEKLDKTKINILKIDSETKQPVSGATLVVKDANGNVIEEWVSTTEAKSFNNLNVGTYTLEETKAPEGYRLSDVKRTFSVAQDEKTVSINFTNDKKSSTIVKVLKIDSKTKNAVAGAELVIKNENGDIVKSWKTATDAEIFTDLEKGTYTLEEIKAPEGYGLSTEKKVFTVSEDDQTISLLFENVINPGKVTISKQDITNKQELPGATLQVKDSEGNVVDSWVSTTEPHYIDTLKDGTYILEETQAPEGYELSTEVISFEIVSGKVTETVVMYNKLKPGVVTISKQDITNKQELPGATLQVKDSEGNVVAKWVSTTEPYLISTLADGKYTLQEVIAPNGYVLSSETIEFEIVSGKVTETVVMYNTPEVPVPITSSSISVIISILGLSALAFGTKRIYANVKKN